MSQEENMRIEKDADMIAIKRGFGKQIIQFYKESESTYDKIRKNPRSTYMSIKSKRYSKKEDYQYLGNHNI